jgi:hypothetical protein
VFAAIEFLGVQWVGHRSFVAEFGPLVGSIFIGGVAVYAARLAATTANERQQQQLSHDSARQNEQLAHDTDRQERQLRHDADIRHREFARDALDSALELTQESNGSIVSFQTAIERFERIRDEGRETGYPWDEQQEVAAKIIEMLVTVVRLMVRFGSEHPIPVRYRELASKIDAQEEALKVARERKRSPEELTEYVERDRTANKAFAALMVECQIWLKVIGADNAS